MSTGIAGDTGVGTINGIPVEEYMLIELRVISILTQSQSGNVSLDELRVLRNDQAFELGFSQPIVGN